MWRNLEGDCRKIPSSIAKMYRRDPSTRERQLQLNTSSLHPVWESTRQVGVARHAKLGIKTAHRKQNIIDYSNFECKPHESSARRSVRSISCKCTEMCTTRSAAEKTAQAPWSQPKAHHEYLSLKAWRPEPECWLTLSHSAQLVVTNTSTPSTTPLFTQPIDPS